MKFHSDKKRADNLISYFDHLTSRSPQEIKAENDLLMQAESKLRELIRCELPSDIDREALERFFTPEMIKRVVFCPNMHIDAVDDVGIDGMAPGFMLLQEMRYEGVESLAERSWLLGETVRTVPFLSVPVADYAFMPRKKFYFSRILSSSRVSKNTFDFLWSKVSNGQELAKFMEGLKQLPAQTEAAPDRDQAEAPSPPEVFQRSAQQITNKKSPNRLLGASIVAGMLVGSSMATNSFVAQAGFFPGMLAHCVVGVSVIVGAAAGALIANVSSLLIATGAKKACGEDSKIAKAIERACVIAVFGAAIWGGRMGYQVVSEKMTHITTHFKDAAEQTSSIPVGPNYVTMEKGRAVSKFSLTQG